MINFSQFTVVRGNITRYATVSMSCRLTLSTHLDDSQKGFLSTVRLFEDVNEKSA